METIVVKFTVSKNKYAYKKKNSIQNLGSWVTDYFYSSVQIFSKYIYFRFNMFINKRQVRVKYKMIMNLFPFL